MYVTATSPYIFMAVLLVRNCMLDGAREGILYYIRPDFTKMKEIQVKCCFSLYACNYLFIPIQLPQFAGEI